MARETVWESEVCVDALRRVNKWNEVAKGRKRGGRGGTL